MSNKIIYPGQRNIKTKIFQELSSNAYVEAAEAAAKWISRFEVKKENRNKQQCMLPLCK